MRVGGGCPLELNANDTRRDDAARRQKTLSFYCGNPARGSPFPMPRGVLSSMNFSYVARNSFTYEKFMEDNKFPLVNDVGWAMVDGGW